MRRIGSGAVLLSAGVVVGAVVGGGLPTVGGSVAVAASPSPSVSPSVTPSASPSSSPSASLSGGPSVSPSVTPSLSALQEPSGGSGKVGRAAAGVQDLETATAARRAAERATSVDNNGAVTFGGQSLPDLLVSPPLRTDGPLRLTVGLGDSITYRAGSWFRRVCGAGVLDTCRDAGIRGDTTEGMLERLDTDVLALKPQVVTIMAGTNDMNYGTTTAQTMRNLARMVTRVQKSGATVVLCTIAPRHPSPKQALALNTAIRKYAKKHDVALLDTYTVLGTTKGRFKKGLTKDGVHPNAAGMAAMAAYAEARLPDLID